MRRALVPETVRALALILTLAIPGAALAAPPGPAPLRPLDERTLGIGESHDYYFPMKKGEYLRIDVEQNDDIDAGIRLFDSTGKLLLHANSYTGTHGAETLSWIAERAEVLWVQVYAWGRSKGGFTALSDGPRKPTPYDRRRAEAVFALFEGIRLIETQPSPLLWLAERSFYTALDFWTRLSEPRWTLITRCHVANVTYSRGKATEGRRIYRELLPTAMTLNEAETVTEATSFLLEGEMEAGNIDSFDYYASIALAFLPALTPSSAEVKASYFATEATRAGKLELAAKFRSIETDSLQLIGDSEKLTLALGELARILRRLGRIDDALRAAQLQAQAARTQTERAAAKLSTGLTYFGADQAELALRTLEEARKLSDSSSLSADIEYALGRAYYDAGDLSSASMSFRAAAALRSPDLPSILDWAFLALIELELGDLETAKSSYERASQIRKPTDASTAAFLHRVRSELLYRQGLWQEALHSLNLAFTELEKQRRDSASDVLRVSYWSTKVLYFDFAVELLEALDKSHPTEHLTARAFSLIDNSRAPVLVERLSEGRGDISRTRTERLESSLAAIDGRLAALRALRPEAWRLLETALLRERADLLLRSALAEAQLPRPRSVMKGLTLTDLQQRLGIDEQFISFYLGRRKSYAWIVDRSRAEVVLLPSRKSIEKAAHELIESVHDARASSSAATNEAASRFSDLIWLPLSKALRTNRLLLSLDGILHRVPFPALPDPTSPGSILLDRWDISAVPSLRVLFLLREPRLPCHGTGLVVGQEHREQLIVDRRAVEQFDPQLSQLPASRQAILGGGLEPFCVVHFATHGTTDSSWPDTGALILSERSSRDRVYAFEIRDLEIRAKVVVLAACESGTGDVRGEGLFGLSAAFLGAGARQVVAALWSVDSMATGELMELFYMHYDLEADASVALARAQRAFRLRPGRASPKLWAGFQVIGVVEAVL